MTHNDENPAFQTLMRFYAAETAFLAPDGGDFSPIAETLDPECALHVPESLAYGGSYFGPEGYRQWSAGFSEQWASLEVVEPAFYAVDDVVFVVAQVHAVARRTGNRVDWPLVQIVRVRNEKILELKAFYWDTAAVLTAMAV